MKRRRFFTAIGTLAIGSGTVLGTGAFDVTSSNSNSSLSVVTAGDDANLDIVPGYDESISGASVGSDIVVTPDSNLDYFDSDGNILFGELSLADLPLAVVSDPGQGMVNVQVAVAVGTPADQIDFGDIVAVVNNEGSQSYDVEFAYTGYGNVVGTTVNGHQITKSVANSVFEFQDSDGTQISPSGSDGSTAANSVSVTSGGGTELVSLVVNADNTTLVDAYGDVYADPHTGAGDFSDQDGQAEHEPLVQEVTAGATEP